MGCKGSQVQILLSRFYFSLIFVLFSVLSLIVFLSLTWSKMMPLDVDTISSIGRSFGQWIQNSNNVTALADAVNGAITEYEQQRQDRVHVVGAPDVTSPADTTGNAFNFFCAAANGVANFARDISATVLDLALSNSALEFRKKFQKIDRDNAQLAFLYISQFQWEREQHSGGIGRASLATRIFSSAFALFVESAKKTNPAPTTDCSDDDVADVVLVGESSEKRLPYKADATSSKQKKENKTTQPTIQEDELSSVASTIVHLWGTQKLNPLMIDGQAKEIFLSLYSSEFVVELKRKLQPILIKTTTPERVVATENCTQ